MCKFEIYEGRDGQYYFRLKAANGEIIAQSEGYTTKQNARNGVQAVQKCAPSASIVELK